MVARLLQVVLQAHRHSISPECALSAAETGSKGVHLSKEIVLLKGPIERVSAIKPRGVDGDQHLPK
jgi:hypothetical protein